MQLGSVPEDEAKTYVALPEDEAEEEGGYKVTLRDVATAVIVIVAACCGYAGGHFQAAGTSKDSSDYGCGGVVEGLTDVHACFESFRLASPDDIYCWRTCLDEQAVRALKALKAYNLNVITAESLTSGMIASTLVDITPGFGSYVYGGHAVYDSDAKRMFLGVEIGDVYTETCARQMAAGAINSGRAMVGVAVTGHAGPVPYADLHTKLGHVNAAVSIRSKSINGNATLWKSFSFCDADGSQSTRDICAQLIAEADASPNHFGHVATLKAVRNAIRAETVAAALDMIATHINDFCKAGTCADGLLSVPKENYDGNYSDYGEPSWIIQANLPPA